MPDQNPVFSESQKQLGEWAGRASFIIGDIFDEVSKRFTEDALPDEKERLTLWQLQGSCQSTSVSSLILTGHVCLWDSDILVRSVVEGSLKFLFLVLGDETERNQKFYEFEHALFEISELKRNARLEEIMAILKDPEGDEWRPFRDILLSPERVAELRERYPKDYRRKIEQRWAFGNICSLLKQDAPPEFSRFGHMMYNFGTSSHIIHQDIVGIGMVWERSSRSDERRVAVELAHGGRLVSDICAMSWLRAYAFLKRCHMDTAVLRTYYERTTQLESEMKTARAPFNKLELGL